MNCLGEISKLSNLIATNAENAKKLDIKKAIYYWENIHHYGFTLAFLIAEDKEYYKEEE